MKTTSWILPAIGIVLLIFVAGWWARGEYGYAVIDVRTVTIDHFFEIPGRSDTVHGIAIVPDADRINHVDSAIGNAVLGDSLKQWTETLSQEFYLTKRDSIRMEDSTISVSIGITDSLRIDPMRKIAEPWTRMFHDIDIQSKHRETIVEKQPTFIDRILDNMWIKTILYVLGVLKIIDVFRK